jgi:hypothetical protein
MHSLLDFIIYEEYFVFFFISVLLGPRDKRATYAASTLFSVFRKTRFRDFE